MALPLFGAYSMSSTQKSPLQDTGNHATSHVTCFAAIIRKSVAIPRKQSELMDYLTFTLRVYLTLFLSKIKILFLKFLYDNTCEAIKICASKNVLFKKGGS